MKVLRNIIFGLIVIAMVLAAIIANYSKNTVVDEQSISSITIINYHYGLIQNLVGPAKEIKNKEDIKAICDAFNNANYQEIKKSDMETLFGGGRYIFRFNYTSGNIKKITYVENYYIFLGDKIYKTNSREFEKYWDLDYPIIDWQWYFDSNGTLTD